MHPHALLSVMFGVDCIRKRVNLLYFMRKNSGAHTRAGVTHQQKTQENLAGSEAVIKMSQNAIVTLKMPKGSVRSL